MANQIAFDLTELNEATRGVIGELCWAARLSYADELQLHMGDKRPYPSKRLGDQQKGAWILGSRGTTWKVLVANGVYITSDNDVELIRQKIPVMENQVVTAFDIEPEHLSLTLTFGNGGQLVISPTLDDDQWDGVPYWELFTPDQACVQVGPGKTWSM